MEERVALSLYFIDDLGMIDELLRGRSSQPRSDCGVVFKSRPNPASTYRCGPE